LIASSLNVGAPPARGRRKNPRSRNGIMSAHPRRDDLPTKLRRPTDRAARSGSSTGSRSRRPYWLSQPRKWQWEAVTCRVVTTPIAALSVILGRGALARSNHGEF
jgi:hypothetical protein